MNVRITRVVSKLTINGVSAKKAYNKYGGFAVYRSVVTVRVPPRPSLG